MEPIWVVSETKEICIKGPQFTFFPFIEKVIFGGKIYAEAESIGDFKQEV
jgi:hypothetical protein